MTDNIAPLVSVIMAVFNEEKHYICASIESILQQYHTNLEFIIINDNPENKEFASFIASFDDPRIISITNGTNIGLTKSLNRGIEMAKGNYIARMDADDISEKDRFEKQVFFLEANPTFFVLGTWAKIINEKNEIINVETNATDSDQIKINSLMQVPFIHPTVMFRREVFHEYGYRYNADFKYAQDFELWSRVVHQFSTANLPEYLLKYRRSSNQISQKGKLEQTEYFIDAIKNQLESFNINVSEDRRKLIKLITRNHDSLPVHYDDLLLLKGLIGDVYSYNIKTSHFHSAKLRTFLRQKYLGCFHYYKGSFSDYFIIYYKMELGIFKSFSIVGFLKLSKRLFCNTKRKYTTSVNLKS